MKLFESKHVKIVVRRTTRKERVEGIVALIIVLAFVGWLLWQ
ncbi:hypothetical protein [Furfurilactobacillus entadae]